MIVVDSSVWIDHLRTGIDDLGTILLQGEVIQHDFVTAELALGSLANRVQVIAHLAALPQLAAVSQGQLFDFITSAELAGSGIGFVDAHLLAACCAHDHQLWTRDKRLNTKAGKLGCAYPAA